MIDTVTQRRTAESLLTFWNCYMTTPLVVEQCMTWLDSYSEDVVKYGIREAAKKQAKRQGQMTQDALTAYATSIMHHESMRRVA
jgi:hypothetical protein